MKIEQESELVQRIEMDVPESLGSCSLATERIVNEAISFLLNGGASNEFHKALETYRKHLRANCEDIESQKQAQLIKSAQRRANGIYFLDDEWGRQLNAWVDENGSQDSFIEDLDAVLRAKPANKPTAKWSRSIRSLFDKYSEKVVLVHIRHFLGLLADLVRTEEEGLAYPTEVQLKGMIWILSSAQNCDDHLLLKRLAVRCFRKVPDHGPISVACGNLCVKLLASMDSREGLEALNELAFTVQYPSNAAKMIQKELQKAAEAKGVSLDELESAAVPTYGLAD